MSRIKAKIDHSWIPDVLRDLETYADLHDRPKVVALIGAARGSVSHAMAEVERKSEGTGKTDEQWFDIALDELARYCHLHGFTETEEHLVTALGCWIDAEDATSCKGNVIPFPAKAP
ncbi:MAG: hypothetical protein P8N72_10945 [Flavimaricola sp.]|nr:hypothetical protein [Flavimaricola sp.]